ncbi:unnamed protein product [Peniophora sp. CBMAI 1063]|nr:unnamed protein product [Peniophora sp. CBMAI 1063]
MSSTDEQRQSVESLLHWITEDVWAHLEHYLVMPEDDRTKMPSPDFVDVLRSAGLDEWLEPGSTLSTTPRDGPQFYPLMPGPSGNMCVAILRKLAQFVNFEAYFERAAVAQRPPMTSPILGTDNNSEHPHLTLPGADVSDDTESSSSRSAQISTIDGSNVEGVRDLPADSEHGQSALAAGKDAATDPYADPSAKLGSVVDHVELKQRPATMTAARYRDVRGEDERAEAAELKTITIGRDREAHTANGGTDEAPVMDARAR